MSSKRKGRYNAKTRMLLIGSVGLLKGGPLRGKGRIACLVMMASKLKTEL